MADTIFKKPVVSLFVVIAIIAGITLTAIFGNAKDLSTVMAILAVVTISMVGLLSDLLREGNGTNLRYSFSRFQLWVWTIVICPAFCLYWGWHDEVSINDTSLILLGISGGTTLTSMAIKSTQLAGAGALSKRHKALTPETDSMIIDILTDDQGQLSIVRLQNLIFTFIFIGVYISMFFPKKEYPSFDETAFTLMGISSGSYLIGRGLYR